MEYLYDEMSSAQKRELETHVKGCAPCRERRVELRGTTHSLDQWKVEAPAKHEFAARWQPGLKWAAAAALLVTTAFATGRMSRPEIDVAALQAQISKPLEEKMQREALLASERALAAAQEKFQAEIQARIQAVAAKAVAEANATTKQHLKELAVTLATLREEDKKNLAATLQTFESQRISDLRSFREDLERVALYSEQSYRTAQRQLVQLAGYTQPTNQ